MGKLSPVKMKHWQTGEKNTLIYNFITSSTTKHKHPVISSPENLLQPNTIMLKSNQCRRKTFAIHPIRRVGNKVAHLHGSPAKELAKC